MSQKDCIVIGGGHNGLTAASTLAKSGKSVVLLEKDKIGGLCRSETQASGWQTLGTLADTSVIRENVVNALGLKKHGLKFNAKPDSIFCPQKKEEGPGLLLHHDAAEAQSEIAKLSEKDAKAYKEYRNFINRVRPLFRKIFDAPAPDIATMSFPGLWDVMKKAISLRALGKKDMMEVLRIGPMCVADWLGEWFESDLLKATLAGPAVYGTWCGPWSPSTNANLIIYECLKTSSVEGGAPALISTLRAFAEKSGVELREDSEVKKVIVENGKAVGVELADGSKLNAKSVFSSVDPKQSILELVDQREIDPTFELRVDNFRMRGTTAIAHVCLNGKLSFDCRPDLDANLIRICEGVDDLERAFDAVKYREFSERPALEIHSQSSGDKTILHIAIHFVPYDIDEGWSDETRSRLQGIVVNRISEYANGFKDQIEDFVLLTPREIAAQFSLSGGHLHHGEHAPDQLLVRPTLESSNYKTPVDGLVLCGSGSHPGGGITCGPGYYGAQAGI